MIFALPFALEEEDDDRLLLVRYCRLVASAMLEEEEEAPQAAVEQAIIGSTRVVAIATRGSLHKRWQLHERWQDTTTARGLNSSIRAAGVAGRRMLQSTCSLSDLRRGRGGAQREFDNGVFCDAGGWI